MFPASGMKFRTAERFQTGPIRIARHVEQADRADDDVEAQRFAAGRFDIVGVLLIVPNRFGDPRVVAHPRGNSKRSITVWT